MAEGSRQLIAFNRGLVSPRGLARIDLERMVMSAETMVNWMPRVLGSMMLRPGLRFINRMESDTVGRGRLFPFMFSVEDTVILEMSGAGTMQVLVDDVRLASVVITSAVSNGFFNSDISGWTDASQTSGNAVWVTGGYAGLSGNGTDFGILRQTITVAVADENDPHFCNIVIQDGPVRLKIGSTVGGDEYISETRLERGVHTIVVTPTGDFTIEFANEREFTATVDECTIAFTAGDYAYSSPYADYDESHSARHAQSGDIIYFANQTDPLYRIERRGDGMSWSKVFYLPEDGPFRTQNITGVTLTPSAIFGDINLTASEAMFEQAHADNRSIWRVASAGQVVSKAISTADDYTDSIRVVGQGTARSFGIIIEDNATGTYTVHLQFSFDNSTWNDQGTTWTSPVSTNYDDGQDDTIIYYRLGVKAGNIAGGAVVTCTLNYSGGSIEGVCRIYEFTSTTVCKAHVLKDFGSINASRDWWEGEWSDVRGWPDAVVIQEGRLWHAGNDKIWGSVSDQYDSHDDTTEGDSGPISRNIGFGPIKIVHWLLGLGRLIIGTADTSANIEAVKMDGNNPISARSSNFDEPLTPFNFNLKSVSSRGLFVDRTEQRLYELFYDIDSQDYSSRDLNIFTPDLNTLGITQIAVQMKPDIRVHCLRRDGTVGMLVYDRAENVICWHEIKSLGATGIIEEVAILPGIVEDQVYYVIKRTINALTERHICKWALESDAIGGTVNKMADSFVEYSGAATLTPFTTELLHLRDEEVVVWADGAYVGDFTVSATGGLTLLVAASDVVAGLTYRGQFKSSKLGAMDGIGLLDRKKVNKLGFVAENLHHLGIQYGPDFDNLYDLPQVEKGQTIVVDTVHSEYHEDNFPFGGEWDTDSRICLQADAPKPATIRAAIAIFESVEKAPQGS